MSRLATVVSTLLLLAGTVLAQPDIEHLITAQTVPAGVVFEILEEDEYALGWALPLVQGHAELLKTRFPELPIAVVSHGLEQFGLLESERSGRMSTIHRDARDLVGAGIDVHVCGAHASQYGHTPEDFPDYVDVAASGPALLNDYRSLGFDVIRIEQPEP